LYHMEPFFFCLAVALILFESDPGLRTSRTVVWALVLALALSGLVKFTFLVAGATAVGVVSVDALAHRRMPWLLPAWIVAVVVLWLVVGQDPKSLLAFLRGSAEVSGGYSEAMALRGPNGEVLAVLGAIVLLCAVVLATEWPRDRIAAVLQ